MQKLTRRGRRFDSELPSLLRASTQPSYTQDEYSLGRMLASEGGSRTEKRLVAHTALNQATLREVSITSLLIRSTDTVADGFYGEQIGRYASTLRAPMQVDLDIARETLQDHPALDLSDGAISFLSPLVWLQGGMQGGRSLDPFADKMADWSVDRLAFFQPRYQRQQAISPLRLAVFKRVTLQAQALENNQQLVAMVLDASRPSRPTAVASTTSISPLMIGLGVVLLLGFTV